MSDSDARFPAQSPDAQLAAFRERMKSFERDQTRTEKNVERVQGDIGAILGEVSDLKNEFKSSFATMQSQLSPILEHYWNEHPSRAHRPSTPVPPPQSKNFISKALSADKTIYIVAGGFVGLTKIIELLVTALLSFMQPHIAIPSTQSVSPPPNAIIAPAK